MDKIALWKNVRIDDWTAEKAIIASNRTSLKFHSPAEFSTR